jgi:hypothetical protein
MKFAIHPSKVKRKQNEQKMAQESKIGIYPEEFDKIWLLTTLFAKVGNKDVTMIKDLSTC